MTTPEAAVAEYWRLKPLIYRQPPGFGNPVTVQEWPPNAPRYSWASMGSVDHCGLSMNTLLHNIGLVFERDYPNCAWTPTAYQWAVGPGGNIAFTDIQPGDLLLYRDPGSNQLATHIGIALSSWSNGGVTSGEFNTTLEGTGEEYWRTDNGYLVAAGRPTYSPTTVTQPTAAPNEQTVYDWARSQGLSPAGAAALLATMLAESGIDPARTEGDAGWDALQNDGVWPGGAGYLQWTNTRDPVTGATSYRRDNLAAFAAARGKPWSDGPTQLDFMLSEIAANQADTAMWARVKAATDPVAATRDLNDGGDNPDYPGFIRPGVYGDRDLFAATFHRRIVAGEFGAATPPAPLPPPYLPVHNDVYLGDDMATTLIIDVDGAPAGLPTVWEYTGAVLQPFLDASLSGGFVRQKRSYGMFLELFRRYLVVSRLRLDGVPVEQQLRDHAKAALEKFNAGA